MKIIQRNLRQLNLSLVLFLLVLFYSASAFSKDSHFADIHIHYNWDQAEHTKIETAIAAMRKQGVGLAVISSTPTPLALEMRQRAGNWVIPFFSPYTHELGKRDWFKNLSLLKQIEHALKEKKYFGVGEIHFMSGFPPRHNNENFIGIMRLAKQYSVPVLIHVDASDERYFTKICQDHPGVKILFAHAGGNLKPSHIDKIMTACDNVWLDLSARDPWRYGGLTSDKGIESDWRKIILQYPSRILTGTDPVWRVTRTQSWDQPDDGWDHYQKLYEFHQRWISELPADVQRKIRWDNAMELLGLTQQDLKP